MSIEKGVACSRRQGVSMSLMFDNMLTRYRVKACHPVGEMSYEFTAKRWPLVAMVDRGLRRAD
jgi:hypothetical protein